MVQISNSQTFTGHLSVTADSRNAPLLPDAGLDIPLPEMRKRRVEVICATFLNSPPGQIAAEIGLLKFILEITVSTTKPRT